MHPLQTVVHVRVAGCKGIVEIPRAQLAPAEAAPQLELALEAVGDG